MAKNRYGKMQGNAQYNRPSGGYQKNLYKQQLNTQGVKQPKGLDQKTVRLWMIIGGVIMLAVTVLLTVKFKWIGLLVGLLVALAAVAGLYFFIQHKEKEMIGYYKKIGMTEELYVKELRKRGVDKKQIDQVRKTWHKVNVEPVIPQNTKKKK